MFTNNSYQQKIIQLLDAIDDDQLELTVKKMNTEHLSRLLWYVEGEVMSRYGNFQKKRRFK